MSLLIPLLVATSGEVMGASNAAAPPSAPRIECEITMPRWCIASFDGTISMEDNGETRVWSLRSASEMAAGPLIIVEDAPYCSGHEPFDISVGASAREQVDKDQFITRTFRLGTNGCTLEFRWPAAGISDRSYLRTILYDVMAGPSQDDMRQLGPATNTSPPWQDQPPKFDLGTRH